ncbi:MAG: AAA family ATPase [Acidimicrobiales bacterium]
MRPVRLELEGFAAFRERTVVDFEGADLFAFTGPTGAGKSTLVDAMVFALYGSVPRYGDRRLVAPAISQGAAEARVRLDFTVEGVTYVAVRVVRRTKTGASTKEARLETAAGELLAGNEKELGGAVERLLGLEYDHFCKCVVLPQGRFAEFLHDKPEARQELLVELLDLGVYRQMGRMARQRATNAGIRAAALDGRLGSLAWATPERRTELTARIDQLQALAADIEAELPAIDELGRRRTSAATEATGARDRARELGRVRVPDGVPELASAVADATRALTDARRVEEAAEAATGEAEQALTAKPRRSDLEDVLRRHELRDGHREQRTKGDRLRVERAAHEAEAGARLARAERTSTEAEAGLAAVERSHLAHTVAARLEVGKPCPVCRQLVTARPDIDEPADLASARRAKDEARRGVDRARTEHHEAERELHRVEDKLSSIAQQLAELDDQLASAPDAPKARRLLAEVDAAEKALEAARQTELAARRALRSAEQRANELGQRATAARVGFDHERDRLTGLAQATTTAMPDRSGDLAVDWDAMAAWAGAESAAQARLADDLERRADEIEAERRRRVQDLATRCAACDIEVDVAGGRSPRDAVVDRLARSESERHRLDEAMAEAVVLGAELARVRAVGDVAGELGRHLAAAGFERWVLDEALLVLVDGATEVLRDLSGGQYSLDLDPRSRNFTVIDHRNADQPRSARTLSGGETFLASLALALALADQLALLAARGGARLESIFLDEGFGSLDPATLDVVASAIEELGAQGRMVGLISHVAELADRVPVRFLVGKVGTGAAVQRVDQ